MSTIENLSPDEYDLALWFKAKELEMLDLQDLNPLAFDYFDGKAIAFSESWEQIVFRGATAHPLEYNKANEEWCAEFDGDWSRVV